LMGMSVRSSRLVMPDTERHEIRSGRELWPKASRGGCIPGRSGISGPSSGGGLGELEPVVLSGSACGVDGCGWDEFGVAVAGELDGPALAVDLLVVVEAEQRAVV